ncbi:MAG: protein phosphatase 2C domain-containing protein [Actinomycetota bacterium]|nr:protein phosphatase 2C domain-containing protein [Actinomycetota bacterium]
MAPTLRFSAISDVGRRRKNDDSGYAGDHFVMVADGMGGAPHGDLASAVAVQTLQRLDAPAPHDMVEALAGAVHRANDRLAELIEEDSTTEGMGTTVTAALFDGERIAVAHLGDSRGYLWHDGELLRITRDHSWVQSLIDEGRITEEEAASHSHRSLLLKVLDGRHDNDPDLTLYDVEVGDRILLCSDGLSSFVEHDRIAAAMSIGSADSVAAELIQLALDSPSNDNITVVVADVVAEGAAGSEPLVVGAAAAPPRGARSRIRGWAHRDEAVAPGEALLDPDVDPEELRYASREPRRFQSARRLALVVVLLALLIAGGIVSYNWTQTQYYVAEADGQVAIYRGVQANLPGVALNQVYAETDLTLDQLPSFWRSQVAEGLAADSLEDAQGIVGRLKGFARTCATEVQQATTTSSTRSSTTTRPDGEGQTGTVSKSPRTSGSKSDAQTRDATREPTRQPTESDPITKDRDSAPTTAEDTGADGDTEVQDCAGATPSPETSR